MPVWTKVLESLPKVAAEAYEALAPTTKTFLEKAVPATEGRIVPIMNVAKKVIPESKEISGIEQVLYPLSSHYHSVSKGTNFKKASTELYAQYLEDSREMSLPLREVAAAGKQGKPYEITKIGDATLPSSTSQIRYQAQIREAQDKLAKSKSLGNTKDVAYQETKLKQLEPLVAGNKEIRDLTIPLRTGISPVSTKTREAFAFDSGTSMVADQAAAVTWQDGFVKNARTWWRSLTGKGGPGEGFISMANNKAFQTDMANLMVKSWPQTERYYQRAEVMENLISRYKAAKAAGNAEQEAKVVAAIDKFKPKLVQSLVEVNNLRKPVLSKYFNQPDVRIALYRDPTTKKWVEPLMSPGEKKVAESHQWLMEQARDLAEAHGIPVLDRDKQYVTHLTGKLAQMAGKQLGKVELERMNRALPSIIKFQRRNPGSLNFFPSIHASTEAYIPMVARKVTETALASKWKPIIEQDLKHWPNTQKAIKKHLEQFLNKSMDENFWEKAMRQMTWWTYFTKVGLSVPVAVKHMVKFGGALAMHPRDVPAAIPKVIRGGMELALQRLGVKPGAYARIMRNNFAARNLLEDISGLAGSPDLKSKMFSVTNLMSGTPVNFVEAFERGINVIAAMNKAQRTGISLKKMQQGIWGTVLDNSFLGRADNFLWLNKPWQRFMAIFAYTPGMIIDRSVRWAMKGLMREKYITEMKAGVLQTAWRMPRDVFGTTYTKHLIAFATILGAAEMYAQHYGVKPWWVLQMGAAHPPSSLTRPIPYEMMKTAEKRGGTAEDWTSTLYDFMTTIPALDKAKQRWQGNLPKAAGGSEFFGLTGIPSAEAAEKFKKQTEKFGGRTFGSKWERKHAKELREKTLLGPLYELGVAPWLRRP